MMPARPMGFTYEKHAHIQAKLHHHEMNVNFTTLGGTRAFYERRKCHTSDTTTNLALPIRQIRDYFLLFDNLQYQVIFQAHSFTLKFGRYMFMRCMKFVR